jgi:hypothetical protein
VKAPLLLGALLLAGCATVDRPLPTPQWLKGAWLVMLKGEGERDLFACNSGLPIAYSADGTYTMWEESGVWSIEGDRLIETATEAHEHVDPAEVALDRRFVNRIERLGADKMRKTLEDGSRMILRRCPPPQ